MLALEALNDNPNDIVRQLFANYTLFKRINRTLYFRLRTEPTSRLFVFFLICCSVTITQIFFFFLQSESSLTSLIISCFVKLWLNLRIEYRLLKKEQLLFLT